MIYSILYFVQVYITIYLFFLYNIYNILNFKLKLRFLKIAIFNLPAKIVGLQRGTVYCVEKKWIKWECSLPDYRLWCEHVLNNDSILYCIFAHSTYIIFFMYFFMLPFDDQLMSNTTGPFLPFFYYFNSYFHSHLYLHLIFILFLVFGLVWFFKIL